MQRKKNIKLLAILGVLVVLTLTTFFLNRSTSALDISKDKFSLADPSKIDKVVLKSSIIGVSLAFENGRWLVNDKYQADPQRISVLFAILKQVKVRRAAAVNQKNELDSLYKAAGVEVSFYEGENIAKQFMVAGDTRKSLTYMTEDDTKDKFLVEIPGYRSYLAGLFELDESGWRNPLVFNLNWANLQSVEVAYNEKVGSNFKIIFDERDYKIDGMNEADSLKLTDFLDDVSLLYVNDYLTRSELSKYKSLLDKPLAKIDIHDIGNNQYSITVFDKVAGGDHLLKIDSLDYALIEESLVKRVLKPRAYFKPDNRR